MILTKESRRTRRKKRPSALCPSQIPHGLMWAQTVLGGERLATNCLSHGAARKARSLIRVAAADDNEEEEE
jgi:hypothetical protein